MTAPGRVAPIGGDLQFLDQRQLIEANRERVLPARCCRRCRQMSVESNDRLLTTLPTAKAEGYPAIVRQRIRRSPS